MNVCFREVRFVVLKPVFLKMQNIVLKTSVLEPAIIPCSSCRRSWLYWVWAGQQASDLRQRQVFFLLFSRYRSSVARSAFCQIDTLGYFLGWKPLGAWVWPVNQLRLVLRLLGTAPIAPYVFMVVYVPTHRTILTWMPCRSWLWCLTRWGWCSGVHWWNVWTL